jgi:hypothetical protein
MSPHAHYEIARTHQQEIARDAINSHRSDVGRNAVDRRRSVRHRVLEMVSAVGVCVVAGTVVTVSSAHSNPRPLKQPAAHVSAQQLAREIRVLEAKGYVPTSCTVGGTLLRNYSTGQSVTVSW